MHNAPHAMNENFNDGALVKEISPIWEFHDAASRDSIL